MITKTISLTIIFWLLIGNSINIVAQSRADLKIAPDKVFTAMFKHAENSDSVRLNKSMEYIQPLLTHFEQEYSNDFNELIREATKTGNTQKVISIIENLVLTDIIDILQGLENGTIFINQVVWVKIAYKDYFLISSYILSQEGGFEKDRLLKNNLHKLMTIYSNENGFNAIDKNRYTQHTDLIYSTIEILKNYMM